MGQRTPHPTPSTGEWPELFLEPHNGIGQCRPQGWRLHRPPAGMEVGRMRVGQGRGWCRPSPLDLNGHEGRFRRSE